MLDVEFVAGFADERHRVRAGAESPIYRQFRQVFGIVGLHLNSLRRAPKSKMEIGRTLERCGGSETVRQGMFRRPAQSQGVATGRLSQRIEIDDRSRRLVRRHSCTVSAQGWSAERYKNTRFSGRKLYGKAKEMMLPPDAIATCCRPFTRYVMGEALHSWPVSKCHSVFPDLASTAAKLPPVSP